MDYSSSSARLQRSGGRRGIVLLEALVAMAVFAVAVLGIAKALNRAVANAREVRVAAAITREMENIMEETLHQPEFEEGEWSVEKDPSESLLPVPIVVHTSIMEVELENIDGEPIAGLFEVNLEIESLDVRDEGKLWSLRTLVYPPLYSAN